MRILLLCTYIRVPYLAVDEFNGRQVSQKKPVVSDLRGKDRRSASLGQPSVQRNIVSKQKLQE